MPAYFIFHGATAPSGLLIIVASRSHPLDTSHSVGILWTGDQPVAETSILQHTTLTRDRHPCPRRGSNPQSQQTSGRKPRLRPRGHQDLRWPAYTLRIGSVNPLRH